MHVLYCILHKKEQVGLPHVCLILHVIKGEYSFSFSKLGQVYSAVLLVIINLVEREEGEGREGEENGKPEVMVPS